MHRHFQQLYWRVLAQTQKKEADLLQYYEQDRRSIKFTRSGSATTLLHEYDLNVLSDIMGNRDMFFGGHVNVFQPLGRANLEEGGACAIYRYQSSSPEELDRV
jgi:hypothetical protein